MTKQNPSEAMHAEEPWYSGCPSGGITGPTTAVGTPFVDRDRLYTVVTFGHETVAVVPAPAHGKFGYSAPNNIDEARANAARIVACVNACAGIADPADLRAQRDALLEAAQVVLDGLNERIDFAAAHDRHKVPVFKGIADLSAAIAAVKGDGE